MSGTPSLKMQTTVAPGSSGGPLLDHFAHVVGVNTAVASPGLSLAVDVARVEALLALERDADADALPLLPKPITLVKADLPAELMPTERMQVEQLLETLTAELSTQVTLEAESGRLDLSPQDCAQEGMVADCATLRRELGLLSGIFGDVPTANGGTGTLELALHPMRLPTAHGRHGPPALDRGPCTPGDPVASELDLLRLQLAFTLHMADQVLGADAELADAERSWLHDRFPPDMLAATGFLDEHGHLTHAFEEARDDALIILPHELPESGKWQVMETLVHAAAADGVLAAEESLALAHAAKLLGVSDEDWSQHLEEMFAAGTLKRDGCGA